MKFDEALLIAQGSPSPDEHFLEACTVVITTLEAEADHKAEALISRGIGHAMAHRYPQALSDLDDAVRQNPTLDRAYVNRATLHAILREDQMALSDFGRAIDLNPTNSIVYAGRAQVFRRLGMIDKAIADVAMARALDQGNPYLEHLWEQLADESWTTTRPN